MRALPWLGPGSGPRDLQRLHTTGGGMLRMVVLAAVVGLAAGTMAVLLRKGVHLLAGALEGLRSTPVGILLPAVGAFLGLWIVRVLFREPGGHGVPEVLRAVSRRGGAMRPRSMVSRLLGSLVNVASGGSAGLEGPTVFSTAAVGSSLAGALHLAERPRILLLGCGVAGGIGAIFDAPLAGLMFAAEVVVAEWSLGAVLPMAVSATVATELGRHVFQSEGAFKVEGMDYGLPDLLAVVPLGLLAGVFSLVVMRLIHGMEDRLARLEARPLLGHPGLRAALAGLGVGAIGVAFPGAIGEGYETVEAALHGDLHQQCLIVLALLAAKLLASTLTLGSGAPGGIFAPALVLGALLGDSLDCGLGHLFPEESLAPDGFYALVGMAGLVAGTMQAPFTGIFLVLETTNGWGLTLPLMLVSVLSVLVVRSVQRWSFYTRDLLRSGELIRPGTDRQILEDLTVGEILDEESISIPAGSTLEDLVRILPRTRRNHFAVVDPATGVLRGMLDLASLRGFIFDEDLRRVTPVDTVMDPDVPRIQAGAHLAEAMEAFESSGAWVLPVVDGDRFVGFLSKSRLFDHYRRELVVQTAERE